MIPQEVCFNAHEHVPSGKIMALKWLGIRIWVSVRAHAQLSYTNICTYHMEEITSTLLYIYRNWFMLEIDPSGWKGSV